MVLRRSRGAEGRTRGRMASRHNHRHSRSMRASGTEQQRSDARCLTKPFVRNTLERNAEGRGERGERVERGRGRGRETIGREGGCLPAGDERSPRHQQALRGSWLAQAGEESSLGPRDDREGRAPRGLINVGMEMVDYLWPREMRRV